MRRPGVPRNPKPQSEQRQKARPESKRKDSPRSDKKPQRRVDKPVAPPEQPSTPERSVTRVEIGGWRRYFTPGRATQTFGSRHQPNELAERRNELKRAKSRAVWTRVVMAFSTLIVVATIVWVVFFSSVFALRMDKITVDGISEEVSAEDVIAKVGPWSGTPLPRLSTARLEQRVEEVVVVHTATVNRSWPNGLAITLTLRTPEFAQYRDEEWAVLDSEGVELSTQEDRPTDLAVIEITAAEDMRSRAIGMISSVRAEIDSALAEQIDTYVSDGHTIEMRTVNGPVIKWGDASQSALKARTVLVLLDQRPSEVYDVSTPTRPVTS